jgi:hypothetical protein
MSSRVHSNSSFFELEINFLTRTQFRANFKNSTCLEKTQLGSTQLDSSPKIEPSISSCRWLVESLEAAETNCPKQILDGERVKAFFQRNS